MSMFSYLIILIILSGFGNAFVIIGLLWNKKSRTSFNYFIINICVVDFLIGAFLKSSFVIEDYFEGQKITDTHCYFMTTFMTASPTIVLMTLVVLLTYMIFSSIKRVRLEKLLSPESTFIIIFMLWILIGGMHLIYHKVFGKFGSFCAVEDDILSTTVYSNLTLMVIIIVQHILLFIIHSVKKVKDAVNMRRPEAVYNNLSVELNNDSIEIDGLDRTMRKLVYIQSFLFIIFWIPFYGIRAQYLFDNKVHGIELIVMQLFFYLIGYFKSAVTPLAVIIAYPESRFLYHKIREIEFRKLKNYICAKNNDTEQIVS